MGKINKEYIIEKNIIIAKFMGIITEINPFTPDGGIRVNNKLSLQYDYSWEWLMPVVEKIESLEYPILNKYANITFNRFKNGRYIFWSVNGILDYNDGKKTVVTIKSSNGLVEIEVLYNITVEFIELYNKENERTICNV